METKISTVAWQQSLALKPSPLIFDIPYQTVDIYPVLQDFHHSPKDSIFKSKTAFLKLENGKPEDEQTEVNKSFTLVTHECKRATPCKKISFKIKKQSSLYRRNVSSKSASIPHNKVAELTKKFNEMVDSRSIWEEEKVKLFLKRGDSDADKGKRISIVHKDSIKVSRKPSVKTKPSSDSTNLVIIKTTRKNSFKKPNSANINSTEPEMANKPERPTTLNLNIPASMIEQTSPNGTSVKAAIEIFEKRSSVSLPVKTKPLLPDKPAGLRNLSATLPRRVRSRPLEPSLITTEIKEDTKSTEEINKTEEFAEDKVEVINIPAVLPQRRCDSMYETLNMKKVNTQSLKSVSVDNLNTDVKPSSVLPNNSFLWRDKSPSTTSSRSSINTQFQEKLTPEEKPLPPIPSKTAEIFRPLNTLKTIRSKMPLPKSPVPDETVDYEEIGFTINTETPISEEKFKGYDEITKAVNDFEIVDDPLEEQVNEDDKHYEVINREEKIYEELSSMTTKIDDGYEPIGNQHREDIYETLPVAPVTIRRQVQKPLPPTPSETPTKSEEGDYNCYESIYTKKDGYYESIYGKCLLFVVSVKIVQLVSNSHMAVLSESQV